MSYTIVCDAGDWTDGPFEFRVKFILFKDYGCCPVPLTESDIFYISASQTDEIQERCWEYYVTGCSNDGKNVLANAAFDEIDKYIDEIQFGGGYGFANGYEALLHALRSPMQEVEEQYRPFNMIFTISNSKMHPYGIKRGVSQYPKNFPLTKEMYKIEVTELQEKKRASLYFVGRDHSFCSWIRGCSTNYAPIASYETCLALADTINGWEIEQVLWGHYD